MKYRITKEFRFEAAHQLLPGCFTAKCSDSIHGHSYRVQVTLAQDYLDSNSMVRDFGHLKAWMDEVDQKWDHSLLLPYGLYQQYNKDPKFQELCKKAVCLNENPTAEVLAKFLYVWAHQYNHPVESVTVWETATCSATYSGDLK